MDVLYTAEVTASGDGRAGHVRSADGVIDAQLSVPKGLGGPGGAATNPEQLFAAGYAACFHGALKAVARQAKASVDGSTVTANVSIGKDADGFGLAVELVVALPGHDRAVAEDLVAKAHQMCPYSRATRGNVEVTLTVR
ncbi:peroxiredoxin, Ohr subfamily [Streptoalloteichus tenebrarius]|uniref:Peroxiredoxin, Ohr subfamily n=1 Tax=Streptoalloteichus tenebrarius (strain ATCC 17920 / DSM 40477 / JCM 4838 / CBS 697.72 / NBRC 16177 / NCIMB 11028 / NRRL B-12390 / A12253. 1 / ISP 5477) TaxID=1933 RepID=A0ABT1HPA6_STRSD|nr:organic hydroperoxide resistance protein [Streptoalloteichus tenebrarius]MCP2257342.1 peroxiredoxin, Ohr subfamily [Streptoalloteichus tenebrarius]BFF04252.1 organic hydroperoxide resistance protein [Streptoalloteichus tenebrarius]